MKCKSELRRAVLTQRDALPLTERLRRSQAAAERFLALPEFVQARVVMLFVSFGSEIETRPIITAALAAGKRVVAPRADPQRRALTPCEVRDLDRDLAPGAHGIEEPRRHCPAVDLAEIDVVAVPAVAWSEDGYRLGYGGGYYDRFLPKVGRALAVGLGLELQVVPELPQGPHDQPVEVLVTEEHVRRFRRRPRIVPPANQGQTRER